MPSNAPMDHVQSHWHTLIEDLQASPMEFYKSVEAALRLKQIPQAKNDRVEYKEGGVLSAGREYLHVSRKRLAFDICGAPFGTGFFVSWWLAEERPSLNPLLKIASMLAVLGVVGWIVNSLGLFEGVIAIVVGVPVILMFVQSLSADQGWQEVDDFILAVPFIGWLYERFFEKPTYYKIDTMLMFQEAVRKAVLDVLDDMTKAKGLRMLSESERKPIMREFYRRKAA